MKRVIWKFRVSVNSKFTLDMPEGGFELLAVQMQNGAPWMWVIVDPTQHNVPYRFRVIATGEEFNKTDDLVYLGTFQPLNDLVFHLFRQL